MLVYYCRYVYVLYIPYMRRYESAWLATTMINTLGTLCCTDCTARGKQTKKLKHILWNRMNREWGLVIGDWRLAMESRVIKVITHNKQATVGNF